MIDNKCDCIPLNPELIEETRNNMPDFDDVMELGDFFKVMGDSTRLQILMALFSSEFCVSDLSNLLNMSQSAISHQLKVLRTSKLVKQRRDGRVIYYSLDDDHIKTILDMAYAHIIER
ncbi:MAG: ArsR/SmtB family transcription factor [Erysipelotrichaceae bacterium]